MKTPRVVNIFGNGDAGEEGEYTLIDPNGEPNTGTIAELQNLAELHYGNNIELRVSPISEPEF
ncbi:MAG TPA: hypothetical protein VK203_10760 [Nostocaceae cyanobacterium]|nr:hypothetical protein [Nostocaceae cyanobacterium]